MLPVVTDHSEGRSPPTRGSQPCRERHAHAGGSIPAHAGEPHPSRRRSRRRGVDPRPRGGAEAERERYSPEAGRSPPTRGSPRPETPRGGSVGSIPAHAGEPQEVAKTGMTYAVDPRPRGGAGGRVARAPDESGRSPPTRGSRVVVLGPDVERGSIPAHAGEPTLPPTRSLVTRVDPRPRGGAARGGAVVSGRRGRSPPTRGSHLNCHGHHPRAGSIPAHAGEPRARRAARP